MHDPGPPVVLPGLLDPSEEPWAEDTTKAVKAPPARPAREAVRGEDGAERTTVSPAAEPAHVEAGETLVAELADPGAEDGAGAELHVTEPWQRYDALSAADIVDRLATQDRAALSVLLLYERTHRARKTVLEAAERELERRG